MEAWSMIVGAVLLHALSLALSESVSGVRWTNEGVLALAYLALVASAAGFLIYFDLLDRLGPIQINLVSYAAPVFAAITGWLLLDETITSSTVAGFGIVLLGFLLLKRDAIRAELAGIGLR